MIDWAIWWKLRDECVLRNLCRNSYCKLVRIHGTEAGPIADGEAALEMGGIITIRKTVPPQYDFF
jgi:hypothetical protein